MTIETKYNIGDEVWVANIFREPIKVKVYGIVAGVKDRNVLIDYHVGLNKNCCTLRKEEELFPNQRRIIKITIKP